MTNAIGYDVSGNQTSTPTDGAFLIVKCTEGTTIFDGQYTNHLSAARAAGIPTDHYLFLRNSPAADQVNWFIANAEVRTAEAIWVDWEDITVPVAVKDAVIAGLQAAYPQNCVGLYADVSFWTSDPGANAGDGLWIADYGVSAPAITSPWVCWQYATDTLDHDQWNGDITAFSAWHAAKLLDPEEEVSFTERDYPIESQQVVAITENPGASAAGATNVWATIGTDTINFPPGTVPIFRVAFHSASQGWVVENAVAVANGTPVALAVPEDCQAISVSPSFPVGVTATLHVVTRFK